MRGRVSFTCMALLGICAMVAVDLVDIVMVLVVPEDLAEETLQETHLHLVHLKEIPVEHNSGQCQLTQQKLEQAEELEARVRLAQQEEPEALAQMFLDNGLLMYQ